MEITKELIARFFTGQCSQTEADAVLRYFEEDPEAAEKYTGKKEWDSIRPADYPLSDEQSERMFAKINAETFQSPFAQIHKWVIAASVILVMTTALLIFYGPTGNPDQMASATKAQQWHSLNNPSEKTVKLTLKDGSTVQLGAYSTISYQVPFPATKRDVRLKGRAFFNVAKDKKRPFTVYSGDVSTTALGTAFTIDAFADEPTIRIKLHEGKVLVKRLNVLNSESNALFYLDPMKELTYNNSSGAVAINIFKENGLSINSKKAESPIAKQTGVTISFDREPLQNVFEEIERAYHISLIFPKQGLKDHYFTGKFNKTDSLERVLRVIAEINQLDISRVRSSYKIERKPKQF